MSVCVDCCCTASVQHVTKSALSQRSVNVLHVNKSQPVIDSKSPDPKPINKLNSGIGAFITCVLVHLSVEMCLSVCLSRLCALSFDSLNL